MFSSDGEVRATRSAAAAFRGGRLHVPDTCHDDLANFLTTTADPTVYADQQEEAMRAEREEIDELVAEVRREVAQENRKARRRVDLGGSRRRIVRLRPLRRPHDPHTTVEAHTADVGEAA